MSGSKHLKRIVGRRNINIRMTELDDYCPDAD